MTKTNNGITKWLAIPLITLTMGIGSINIAQADDPYDVDKFVFDYTPSFNKSKELKIVTQVQNPKIPYQVYGGILANVLGDGLSDCPLQKTCLGDSCFDAYIDDPRTYAETGIYLPHASYPICSYERSATAMPYSGVSQDGIGLYTTNFSNGPWLSHSKKVNKDISAQYAVFSNKRAPVINYPWGMPCVNSSGTATDCNERVAGRFTTEQGVKTIYMPDPHHTQIQQNTRHGFYNTMCDKTKYSCVFVINAKVLCTGKTCREISSMFNDPAQGGMSVAAIIFPPAGEVVKVKAMGKDLAGKYHFTRQDVGISIGAATSNSQTPFCATVTGLEMTRTHLFNLLTGFAEISGQTPLERFGPTWDCASCWQNISNGFGQEVIGQTSLGKRINGDTAVGGYLSGVNVSSVRY